MINNHWEYYLNNLENLDGEGDVVLLAERQTHNPYYNIYIKSGEMLFKRWIWTLRF